MTSRNKIIKITVSFLTLLLLGGCDLFFNNENYPDFVHFPVEGGTETISGDNGIVAVTLYYNGEADGEKLSLPTYDENDNKITSGELHGFEISIDSVNQITITAQPNTTGKAKKMYLRILVLDISASVLITQDA